LRVGQLADTRGRRRRRPSRGCPPARAGGASDPPWSLTGPRAAVWVRGGSSTFARRRGRGPTRAPRTKRRCDGRPHVPRSSGRSLLCRHRLGRLGGRPPSPSTHLPHGCRISTPQGRCRSRRT